MEECRRILKPTGSCWVNIGDTYSTGGEEVTTKSLCGIPGRFQADCIDSGWINRNFDVWYKSNAMPSSVKDRLTNKWEPVLFFVKEPSYYFDLDPIREKCKTESEPFNMRVREAKAGRCRSQTHAGHPV